MMFVKFFKALLKVGFFFLRVKKKTILDPIFLVF